MVRRHFLVGGAVLVLCASCSGGGKRAAVSSTTAAARSTTSTTIASATVAQLAAGRWSTIPAGPLAPRLSSSVVFTGDELVVWGGIATPSGKPENDGAAYNPTTRSWRMLPPSPLTPREGAAAIWTGSEIVFWGGIYPEPPGRVTRPSVEAVTYTPATNTWRTIGVAPLAPANFPMGVWTGDRVVIFSGEGAASYDPATNRWERLPAPTLPTHLPGWQVKRYGWQFAAVAGHGRLLAWSAWDAQKHIAPNGLEGTAGSDLFRYDEASNRWTALAPGPDAIAAPAYAFWNRGRLLVIGTAARPSGSQGPAQGEMTASYDSRTGRATRAPSSAVDQRMWSVWTGDAIWSLGYAASGRLGATSAYDPATNLSRDLKATPFAFQQESAPVPIWTGTSVLVWFSARVYPPEPKTIGGLEYILGSHRAT